MTTPVESSQAYKTEMQVAWEFDYNVDSTVLANLYERAKALQWNAETDIDWDIAVDPSSPIIDEQSMGYTKFPFYEKLSQSQKETLRAHVAAQNLSQFLHGEQGALMTAATLTHSVPDYEAKLYSATQTMDEARHVEVFEKYLRKIAIVYPISPFLKAIIDATISADHWVKTAIGMNLIIEGLAVGSFYNMKSHRRHSGCHPAQHSRREHPRLRPRPAARYVRQPVRRMAPGSADLLPRGLGPPLHELVPHDPDRGGRQVPAEAQRPARLQDLHGDRIGKPETGHVPGGLQGNAAPGPPATLVEEPPK